MQKVGGVPKCCWDIFIHPVCRQPSLLVGFFAHINPATCRPSTSPAAVQHPKTASMTRKVVSRSSILYDSGRLKPASVRNWISSRMAVDPLDGPTAREGCGALAEFCD